jgi:hypothetical protein
MKKYRLVFFFLTITSTSNAQIDINRNHIYFELLGTGGYSSIQYERQLFKTPRILLHGGLGAYFDLGAYFSGILGVTYLQPTKWQNRFIEFGFTMSSTPSEITYYAPGEIVEGLNRYMPHAGFRWYTKKHWVWRTSLLAVMQYREKTMPWLGFSIGKNF